MQQQNQWCKRVYTTFHSNYGTVLLSFQDATTGQKLDGWQTDTHVSIAYLALKVDQQ